MITVIGDAHVYGIPQETLPLSGFPPGRIRLRFRNSRFARAFVRTKDGIREFSIKEESGHWIPGYEQGRNKRHLTRQTLEFERGLRRGDVIRALWIGCDGILLLIYVLGCSLTEGWSSKVALILGLILAQVISHLIRNYVIGLVRGRSKR